MIAVLANVQLHTTVRPSIPSWSGPTIPHVGANVENRVFAMSINFGTGSPVLVSVRKRNVLKVKPSTVIHVNV